MRHANDFYPTPQWATYELLKRIPLSGVILEPCAGNRAISNAIIKYRRLHDNKEQINVITNDIDPFFGCHYRYNAATFDLWRNLTARQIRVNWTITNPPFSLAHAILPHAFDHSHHGIAMLLRLSYLEPCRNRADWLKAHPPAKIMILPRISFTGNGKTDSVTCAWVIWRHDDYLYPNPIEIIPPASPDPLTSTVNP